MADQTARPGPDDRVPPATVDFPHGLPDQTLGPSSASVDTVPSAPVPVLGDHEILEEIGRGGMGVVYRARDRRSGRLVALKMMLADGRAEARRFVLEARAMGELTHPGVVAIHHWGEHDGQPYFTMDFVPGESLDRLLTNGPLPVEQAVRYLLGIGRAVAAAHALNIVHRDLKPGNVILDATDQPRILDFGLAKRHTRGGGRSEKVVEVLDALPADAPMPTGTTPPALNHTERGAILGTPAYMAPEQVRAAHDEVGPPADVHALGAIFFEMLTGRPPFQGEQTYETLMQVARQEAPPLRSVNARVPAVLETVCRRCLQKDAADRYADAGALVADLERRWLRRKQRAHFARRTLAALGVMVALVLAGLLFSEGSPLDLPWLAGRLGVLTGVPLAVNNAFIAAAYLLEVALFVLTPALAGLAEVVWCAAWVRYSSRGRDVTLLWCLVAAVAVVLWLSGALTGLFGAAAVVWLLGNAGAGLIALVWRGWDEREFTESTVPTAEPYLRRLFATRVDARPKAAAQAHGAPESGLADFELGKTLHTGPGCVARWARQRSLDRPVLVWFALEGSGTPGVVVRHPDVIALHGVGSHASGPYLITEGVAATPLPGLLDQRPLTHQEAATFTARLARALQAFHAQGACHGRLSADWILVHGDMEPLLCPCGVPSLSAADRARDVADLGRMLRGWLHDSPRERRDPVLERVCDAAEAGQYARAEEMADDLERAAKVTRVRRREGWAHVLGLFLLLLPMGIVGAFAVGMRLHGRPHELDRDLLVASLVSLALGAVCGAFTFGRGLVQRWRLGWRPGSRDLVLRVATPLRLIPALLVVGLLGVVVGCDVWAGADAVRATWTTLLSVGVFLGFWLLGAWAAALVTFVESLLRSVRPEGSS